MNLAQYGGRVDDAGYQGDPYNEGKRLTPMEKYAYGDDSGTHKGSKVCLVLGYIGSHRQWKLFRHDWQDALTALKLPAGAKREFHAKDFFDRRRWRSRKSPYHNWTDTQARDFLRKLLDAIHRRHLEPIGGATNTVDFFAYSKSQRRWITGATLYTMTHWHQGEFEVIDKLAGHEGSPNRPYFVVFPGFLVDAMNASKDDSEVHLYFDRQKDVEARAREAFDSFKRSVPEAASLVSLTYAESEDEVGLQAADLYAYVWNRELHGTVRGELLSRAFKVLSKKKPKIIFAGKHYFDNVLASGVENRNAGVRNGFRDKP